MDGDYPECDKARALSYDSPFMRLFIPDLSPWPDLISEINMSSERVAPSGVVSTMYGGGGGGGGGGLGKEGFCSRALRRPGWVQR